MRVIVMFIIKLSFVFKRDHVIRLQRDVCVYIEYRRWTTLQYGLFIQVYTEAAVGYK